MYYDLRISSTNTPLNTRSLAEIIDLYFTGNINKGLSKHGDFRKQVGQAYLRVLAPHVPKKTGALIQSAKATTDGRITYGNAMINYATKQYENDLYRHWTWEEVEPGNYRRVGRNYQRTHHWTSWAEPGKPEWDSFIEEITPIITDYINRGIIK